jgi:superfamily II DNA/RNA helicase
MMVHALKEHNIVRISATGSGRTLAFLLLAMIHIEAQVITKRRDCLLLSLLELRIGTRTYRSSMVNTI